MLPNYFPQIGQIQTFAIEWDSIISSFIELFISKLEPPDEPSDDPSDDESSDELFEITSSTY